MAIAYLNEGATSLAAANWSDAAGFANGATLVINAGTQHITTNVDQSQANKSIESLDIIAPFAGNIYGSSFAPLITDADGTVESAANAVSRVRHWASGGVGYFSFAGVTGLAHFFQGGGSCQSNLVGGTVKNIHSEAGNELNINPTIAMTASSEIWLCNNKSFIDTHASNLLDTVYVTAGTHYIKRGFTATTGTLDISGGNVTIDIGAGDIPILKISGSDTRVRIISATFAAGSRMTLKGGLLDLSQLSRVLTFTSATHAPTATVINKPSLVTWTTPVKIGSGAKGL